MLMGNIVYTIKNITLFFISPRGIISTKAFAWGFSFLYALWIIYHLFFFLLISLDLNGCEKYPAKDIPILISSINYISLLQILIDSLLLYSAYAIYRKRLRALEIKVPIKYIFLISIMYIGATFDCWNAAIHYIARQRYETPAYNFVYPGSGSIFILMDIAFYVLIINLLLGLRNPKNKDVINI